MTISRSTDNKKFGIKDTEKTLNTRVIIGQVSIDGDEPVLGVMKSSIDASG
ncbi:MAG TPA: hypothetical protein VMU10_01830 [Desulfomonilia bacterium]|nr:hypothetical protein [Desulfomonilia bacterium]